MMFAGAFIDFLNTVTQAYGLLCVVGFVIFVARKNIDPMAWPYAFAAFMTIFALIPLGLIRLICWIFGVEGFWFIK